MINLYLDIKHFRLERNLTQKELAKKIKISQSYLSKLENNNKSKVLGLKLKTIRDLATVLSVKENKILILDKD
ncbi:helix-turn-helix transcriptional regulator [Clostridium perfringens]|uniref:helix-turn-helix domain-containing protein n=1 Tax=Clostridium perfringens TaxID=1502 RepID=UPI002911A1A4|nr:helix-turn-helix transcriptional regulator [Clostridium perfringens]MDU5658888.1 helix-turn-helix transcriptional regulator [Clostridium perfringens]WVH95250.1 helix-turn-helix transcriptional regulator [Clostridium perfringens]